MGTELLDVGQDGRAPSHAAGKEPSHAAYPLGGGVPQVVASAGCCFGASVDHPRSYALVGCTVSPGFTMEDFELGVRAALVEQYPQHEALIMQLTSAVSGR